MLRPRGCGARFALTAEVSLHQVDHVSLEEPAHSTRAGSATHAPPLIKLVSLAVAPSASDLCLLFLAPPIQRVEVVPVLVA